MFSNYLQSEAGSSHNPQQRFRPRFDQMWSNLGRKIRPIFHHIRLRRIVLIFDLIASNIRRNLRPNVGLSYTTLYSTSLSYLEVEFLDINFRPLCGGHSTNYFFDQMVLYGLLGPILKSFQSHEQRL